MDNTGRNLLIGVIGLVVLAVLGFTLFGQDSVPTNPLATPQVQPESTSLPETNEMVVILNEQNNSTESGQARLREENGEVIVTLNLNNAPETEQPAHIHVGSCPEPGAIRYPLSNVIRGQSVTTISTTLDELRAQAPLAINVHQSPEALEVYVACGDLPQ